MMNRQNKPPVISQQMYPQQPQRPPVQQRPPIAQPDMARNIHALIGKLILGMVVFVALVLVLIMVAANFKTFTSGSGALLQFALQWGKYVLAAIVVGWLLRYFKKELLQLTDYIINKILYAGPAREMAKAKVKHAEAITKQVEVRADNSKFEALSRYEIALATAEEKMALALQKRRYIPTNDQNSAVFVDQYGQPVPIAMPQRELPPNLHSMTYHNAPRIQGETKVTEEAGRPAIKQPVPTGRELLMNGTVEKALADGRIILGPLENGQLAKLKIKKCFSTLVSGLPSTGKTTTVFWIAGQLVIVGARLWIIDPHINFQDEEGNKSLAAELEALADSFVFPPCDDNQQQVLYRMRFMYSELRKRQQPGYIVRAQNTIIGIMDEFNSIAEGIDPAITVVTHEGRELNFARTLALLEREGRKFGLHFMLIGHKWTQQDIGGDNAVRTNATTYLCHQINDQDQARLLLGSRGKELLNLTVGEYWITGPTWNESPAKICTPMISAVDLPLLMQIKSRGVQILNQSNFTENTVSTVVSEDMSASSPIQTSDTFNGHDTEALEKPVDMSGDNTTLTPDLQAKMHLVLDMDAKQSSQNEIISAIWGADPSTRQGRAAAEELRQIRAYLAYLHRKQLQNGMREAQ